MDKNVWFYTKEVLNRIYYILFSFVLSFSICYYYADVFLYTLSIKCSNHFLCTSLSEAFFNFITISFYLSLYITIPYTIYSIGCFISSGLYVSEKREFIKNSIIIIILLYLSLFIAQNYIIPYLFKFFIDSGNLGHGEIFQLEVEPRIESYVQMSIRICLLSHIIVFVPYSMIYYSWNIPRQWLYLVAVMFAAFMAPPDVFVQLGLSMVLLLVVESSVLVVCIKNKYKKRSL